MKRVHMDKRGDGSRSAHFWRNEDSSTEEAAVISNLNGGVNTQITDNEQIVYTLEAYSYVVGA